MIGIIVSQKDPAGCNIKEQLISKGFTQTGAAFEGEPVFQKDRFLIYTTQQELIFAEGIGKGLDVDAIIFASKHKSESGKPTLCCHFPGNWLKAERGGIDKRLCPASALMLKNIYLSMKKDGAGTLFDVTIEVTHHGPLIDKPCLFAEIGSTEKEWGNAEAGAIVAEAILHAADELPQQRFAVGIGGNHYGGQFNSVLEKTNIAMSHICPKHALGNLSEELLRHAIDKTQGKVDFVLVDWRGLGQYKQVVKELLEKAQIPWKRVDQL